MNYITGPDSKPLVIAFYLPQFYPTPENDEWWGPGFTEWTNVARAKPLFRGHNQPRIPADLGFYDLRVPETREKQAELAREAGVGGFCYWHYWFGGGRRMLARVFDEVLESGKPDFPFCLGWANHSWYAKTWDKTAPDKLLMEQRYEGIEDARAHFDFLLRAFSDPRYIKVDGKPFLLVYSVEELPNEYVRWFNEWACEAGYKGLYLVGETFADCAPGALLLKGYNAVLYDRLRMARIEGGVKKRVLYRMRYNRYYAKLCRLLGRPLVFNYNSMVAIMLDTQKDSSEGVLPMIWSQWDHTPRSGVNGIVYTHATPEVFVKFVREGLSLVKHKENKIIMLKSWNEWGEGNFMEPDQTYGKGFIRALKETLLSKC